MLVRLVVISIYPERIEANHAWWDPWEWDVYTPTDTSSIRASHQELAERAIAEGWGHGVWVLQDDVEPIEFPEPSGMITVISGRRRPGDVCPRAFSCSPGGWHHAAAAWSRSGKTCSLWHPDVVLDGYTTYHGG